MWLCFSSQGISLENWGHFLYIQLVHPSSIPLVQLDPMAGSALTVPWQDLPPAWPRVAPQDAGAGMWEGLEEPLWVWSLHPLFLPPHSQSGFRTALFIPCAPTLARAEPVVEWGSAQG